MTERTGRSWLLAAAVVGSIAGLMAAAVIWLLLTDPVSLATAAGSDSQSVLVAVLVAALQALGRLANWI